MSGKSFLTALGAVLLASCSSLASYRYQPSTAELQFVDGGATEPFALAYAHLDGFAKRGGEWVAVARLLVENRGEETVQVVEDELRLFDGALVGFEAPTTDFVSASGWSVGPGDSALYQFTFPLPSGIEEDDVDFSSLTFAAGLRLGVSSRPMSAVFQRVRRQPSTGAFVGPYWGPSWGPYWDPWCDPYWGAGFGAHYSAFGR